MGLAIFATIALYVTGVFSSLTPLPLIFIALKKGQDAFVKASAMAVAGCLALVALPLFFAEPLNALGLESLANMAAIFGSKVFPSYYVLLYHVVSLLVAVFIARSLAGIIEKPRFLYKDLIKTVAWIGAFVALVAAIAILPNWNLFVTEYNETLALTIDQTVELFKNNPSLDAIESAAMIDSFRLAAPKTIYLLPALAGFSLGFYVLLNFVIAKRFFIPLRPHLILLRMVGFRLPFYWVWIVLVSITLLLLNGRFLNNDFVFAIGANGLAFSLQLFFLQGLSVFLFYLDQKRILGWWRLLIYFMTFFLDGWSKLYDSVIF